MKRSCPHAVWTTNHDEPRDEGRVSDIPETAVVDVHLHLQVEEEALVDDVGNPAGRTAQERAEASARPQLEINQGMRRPGVNVQLISDVDIFILSPGRRTHGY